MVNVAIIGAGYIGTMHARILFKNIQNASVTAIVEKIEEKGKKLADELGADYFSDFDEMLNSQNVDVAAVCTPTFLHPDMVLKSASANKHIYCEKPLALTLNSADQMIQNVKDKNLKAISGLVLRFWPVYARARDIIKSGEVGKPLHGYVERTMTFPSYSEGEWHRNEKMSGGVALDIQVHDLDYLTWIFGPPEEVGSKGVYDTAYGGMMHICTTIKFRSGASGLAQVGWGYPVDFPFTMGFRILCEKGTLEWSYRAGNLMETRCKKSKLFVYKNDGSTYSETVEKTDAFMLLWKYFIDCIENDRQVTTATFVDDRKAMKLALATIQSVKKDRIVKI